MCYSMDRVYKLNHRPSLGSSRFNTHPGTILPAPNHGACFMARTIDICCTILYRSFEQLHCKQSSLLMQTTAFTPRLTSVYTPGGSRSGEYDLPTEGKLPIARMVFEPNQAAKHFAHAMLSVCANMRHTRNTFQAIHPQVLFHVASTSVNGERKHVDPWWIGITIVQQSSSG